MKKAGSLIEKVLKQKGLYKTYQYHLAVEHWNDIVGVKIAQNSQAVKVEAGVLWVAVKNSVWLQHLTMLKGEIIRKVCGYTGNNIIKDIYFFQGKIEDNIENNKTSKKNNIKEGATGDKEYTLDLKEINRLLENIPPEQKEIREKVQSIIFKKYR